MNSQAKSSWIPALAGYRALAALAVFGFHIASIKPPEGPLGEWTIPLGSAAVSVFFALSGFLIYRPFAAWALGSGNRVAGPQFILRRAARILPLYWTVLTIHLFVFGRGGAQTLGDYFTAYALIQNFRGALVFIPPFVAWSLSIELWFSVSLPAIAGVLRWAGKGRNLQSRLFIQLFGFAWLAGLATVFRIWALSRPRGGGQLLWMPAYLDWFAAGIFLAILTTYWGIKAPPITVRRLAANPAPIAIVGFLAYWAVTKIGVPGGFVPTTVFQTHTQFLLQALMSLCLIAAAVLPNAQLGLAGRLLSSNFLGWVGSLSYGIYLVHPVVIDEFLARWDISRPILAPITLALTVLSAHLIHNLVEGPAARFVDGRSRMRSGVPAPAAAPPEGTTETKEVGAPGIGQPAQPSQTGKGLGTSEIIQDPVVASINRLSVLAILTGALSVVLTLLARPSIYVADARYELFADPLTRLGRSLTMWDSTRDLGRSAEEFWPGLVLFSSAVASVGAPEWVTERLLHAALLAIAATGAMALSKTLGHQHLSTTVIAGVLYGFGPFSALYLIPSPLYVSYAIAPWVVTGVLRAGRNQSTLRWAGVVSLALFLAGNADPPGLVFALVPALITWLALLIGRPSTRRPLVVFTLTTMVATGLASAAMLVKTSAGATALSHRLVETESAEAVAAASSFSESFRGMGFWLSYLRFGPITFRSQGELFLDNWFMVLTTFVPLIVGLVALARRRHPRDLLAVAWLLSAVVLMSGPHPLENPSPYGRLLLSLYDRSDLAFGFRSTHKAGVGLALATALLGASGLTWFSRIAAARLGSVRWLPVSLVVALLLTLTQPFWRTPLYDPALASSALPEHWEQTAQWFRDNPPQGRVLVLPGTTNNGYRWGSVGDDILDPIIPNRIVASTLPLSTQLSADLIQSLNDFLTSDVYQAGTLSPLAERLGISHVVIRNDLQWNQQGVARPSSLQALRSDPAVSRVAFFGAEGLFTSSPLDPDPSQLEGQLPAIEILALNQTPASLDPGLWRIPNQGPPRQILLAGDGLGVLQAASHDLLDGGHPFRYSASLSNTDLADLASDIALIVLTDTNRQGERKISYYGYDQLPLLASEATQSTTVNHWLPEQFRWESSSTIIELEGAKVSSSIDPWLLGSDHQPVAALDQDETTSWLVPFLTSNRPQSWSIEFSAPNPSTRVSVELLDSGDRIEDLEVLLDGEPIGFARTGQHLELIPTSAFSRLEMRFGEPKVGLDAVGIREVSFSHAAPEIVTSLPTRLVDQIGTNSDLAQRFADTPLTIVLGAYDTAAFTRQVKLWRQDSFALWAEVSSTSPDANCTKKLLSIDGEPVPVQFSPTEPGRGVLTFCPSFGTISLSPGLHDIQFTPVPGYQVGSIRLDSDHPQPAPIARIPLDDSDPFTLAEDDLVLSNAAFDPGWRLEADDGSSLHPIALDTLTGWRVSADMTVETPRFADQSTLNIALVLSLLGLLLSLAFILVPPNVSASAIAPVGTTPGSGRRPVRQHPFGSGLVGQHREIVLALALSVTAYFFVGPFGLLGLSIGLLTRWTMTRWTMSRWPPARHLPFSSLFALSAVGLGIVALLAALPLLVSSVSVVETNAEARLARAVVGLLLAALASGLNPNPVDAAPKRDA